MTILWQIAKFLPSLIVPLVKYLLDRRDINRIKKHYEAKERVRKKLSEMLVNAKEGEQDKIKEVINLINSSGEY